MKGNKNRFKIKYILAYLPRVVMPVFYAIFRTKVYLSKDADRSILCPQGCALIVANHVNYLDPLVITQVFWRRRLRYIIGEAAAASNWKKFVYRHLGCIRIDRNSVDFASIKEAVNLLREGEAMTVFPEGKLHLHAEEVSEFKAGAALMAVIAGAPIIPVYITPKKNCASRVSVMIGAPMDAVSICGRFPTAEGLERLAGELRARVCELKDELENVSSKEEKK